MTLDDLSADTGAEHPLEGLAVGSNYQASNGLSGLSLGTWSKASQPMPFFGRWFDSNIFGIFTPIFLGKWNPIWRLHSFQLGWFNHQLAMNLSWLVNHFYLDAMATMGKKQPWCIIIKVFFFRIQYSERLWQHSSELWGRQSCFTG